MSMMNNRYTVEFDTGLSDAAIDAIKNNISTSMTSSSADWFDINDIHDSIENKEIVVSSEDMTLLNDLSSDGVGYIEIR